MSQKLEKSIGFVLGTSYCVTIIVGAGILGLPGEAAKLAGANSVWAWLADLLLVVPLLIVFGKLITKAQSAGGISDFVRLAFGPGLLFRFSQALLLVTLAVGTAAIAIVGAQYLASGLGLREFGTLILGIVLIFFPTLINLFGIQMSGKWQSVTAALLLSFLFFVIYSSMRRWNLAHAFSFDPHNITGMWSAMGMIWFAFTGVEMVSFLGEEFKSPRVFILSLVTSLFIIAFLYVGLAVAVKELVPAHSPELAKSPITAILTETMGSGVGRLGGVFGFILILVNLTAAILGASRLVFAVGRDGVLLPRSIGSLEGGIPRSALLLLAGTSVLLLAAILIFELPLNSVFTVVSENWFILYVLAILSFLKLADSKTETTIGVASLVLSLLFMSSFSWLLVLPALVFVGTFVAIRKGQTNVAR